jgi:hypothetical protein
LLAPVFGAESALVAAPWRLALVGIAVVVAGVWPRVRRASRAQKTVAGLLLALAAVLVMTDAGQLPLALLCAAGAAGGVLLWGLRGRTLAIGLLVAAGALAVGAAVFTRIGGAAALSSWPPVTTAALAGLGFASLAVLSQLPRHILIVRDRVGQAHQALVGRVSGEVADLALRGLSLWRKTESNLQVGDANREMLEDGVLRLFDVANRWAAVEAETQSETPELLSQRIAELDARIDGASDDIARTQYQEARDALTEQQRYLEGIGTSRERVLARMHNYLAAMERLNLAVVNVKSTSASKSAVDVQPMVESLVDLGRDIDALGEALDS